MKPRLERVREEFPILSRKAYLASHSLGAVPRATAGALARYFDEWSSMGIAAWDGPWWNAVLDFAINIERLLHAPAGTVAPMPNATRAMAAVASALAPTPARDRVVLTDLEFTTSYPLWRGYERAGAKLVIVPSEDGITVPVDWIIDAIDDRTLLVPTCHVYFRSGAIQDLRRIAEAAHAHGAHVLGDGYQAVGTVPVDVVRLGVDFYVGGSHKWLCGGPGAAYLYVRRDLIAGLRPRLTGWFGLGEPFGYKRDLSGGPPSDTVLRFLDGTPNVPGIYAAREGIRLVQDVGVETIRKLSTTLTSDIIDRAQARDYRVRTPLEPGERSGMVCLDFPGADRAVEHLRAENIVADWRPDCGLRVSPHFYNDVEDIDRLFAELPR